MEANGITAAATKRSAARSESLSTESPHNKEKHTFFIPVLCCFPREEAEEEDAGANSDAGPHVELLGSAPLEIDDREVKHFQ